MSASNLRQFPIYTAQIKIGALKIAAIIPNPRGAELHFEDRAFVPIQVSLSWLDEFKPKPGGYFVVDPDTEVTGWASAAEIEVHFILDMIGAGATLDFGDAIRVLKAGSRVARAGWKGKGMWLSLSCTGEREVAAESFWSPHNAQFARDSGGSARVLPCITMKTATGEILMGWLASQTDMLATDWCVVP